MMVRMVSDLLNPAGYAAQHLDPAFFLRFEAIAAAAAARPLLGNPTHPAFLCIVSWADVMKTTNHDTKISYSFKCPGMPELSFQNLSNIGHGPSYLCQSL